MSQGKKNKRHVTVGPAHSECSVNDSLQPAHYWCYSVVWVPSLTVNNQFNMTQVSANISSLCLRRRDQRGWLGLLIQTDPCKLKFHESPKQIPKNVEKQSKFPGHNMVQKQDSHLISTERTQNVTYKFFSCTNLGSIHLLSHPLTNNCMLLSIQAAS